MDGWTDGRTDGWMSGRTEGRMDRWMDGGMDERMDRWMDGWMPDGLSFCYETLECRGPHNAQINSSK